MDFNKPTIEAKYVPELDCFRLTVVSYAGQTNMLLEREAFARLVESLKFVLETAGSK